MQGFILSYHSSCCVDVLPKMRGQIGCRGQCLYERHGIRRANIHGLFQYRSADFLLQSRCGKISGNTGNCSDIHIFCLPPLSLCLITD